MLLLLALALAPWTRREADCDPRAAVAAAHAATLQLAPPNAPEAQAAAAGNAEPDAARAPDAVDAAAAAALSADPPEEPEERAPGAAPRDAEVEQEQRARPADPDQADPFDDDPSSAELSNRGAEEDGTEASRERAASAAFRALETSLQVIAGRQGERRIEAMARAAAGELTVVLGAETLASDRAPERRGAIVGVELTRGGLDWEAELRAMPQAAASSRVAARIGVRSELLAVSVAARAESLGGKRLRAAGAAVELEAPLAEAWSGALSASAWATELLEDRAPSRDPWGAFGAATLDWAERWELSGGLKRQLGPVSIAPAVAVAQPAQPGALSARASLAVEVKLGAARLTAAAAGGHLWPSGIWIADATAGLSWRLGDEER
jgi:hypothetical protein